MTTNAGKRIDKLLKQLDTIATRNKQHHFVIVQGNDDPDAKVQALAAEGIIKEGDDIQLVHIPWKAHRLKGAAYIPEGNTDDPLGDPRLKGKGDIGGTEMGGYASGLAFDPRPHQVTAEREQAWARHVINLEIAGQRYMGET